MEKMTELQRFHACMTYQPVDRIPFWDWGAWPETIERWKAEGYEPRVFEPASLADQRNAVSHLFFPQPAFERQVLAEDEQHIVYVNHEGILMKEMKGNPMSSMPQFLRFPVETRQDFRQFWSERMQPDLDQRFGLNWKDQLRKLRAEDRPLIIVSDRWGGFFGPLRNLVGVQKLCMLFYDDPAFVEEMMEANVDFILAMLAQILDVVAIDAYGLWEDMAYRSGPLISPRMVRKYMFPRYRRVADYLRSRGVSYIGVDSDGQIDGLIPIWLEAGLNFIYPFEVQAGMDVLQVRKKYGGELRIWGGFDKRTLAQSRTAIEAEIDRLLPLMSEGGYIPHTDHSCPPDIPFDNYCYYMRRMAEVAGSL